MRSPRGGITRGRARINRSSQFLRRIRSIARYSCSQLLLPQRVTPMANFEKLPSVLILLSTSLVGGACTIKVQDDTNNSTPPAVETRAFTGDVFDGVTGVHVTQYDIAVDHGGQYERGTLDARGG